MKRTKWTFAAFALALLATREAGAQGYAINRFEPSERGSEWFANESLDLRGHVRPAIGVVGDYQLRPLATYDANDEVQQSVVRHMLTFHVGGAVNLWNRLRLSASLPLVAHTDGESARLPNGTFLRSPTATQALGDLRLGADVRLLGEHRDVATLAIGAQVWLPTGHEASYAGDGKWRIQPHAVVAGDIGIFTYAAKVGFDYRARQDTLGNAPIGSQLAFSAAAGLRLTEGGRLVVGPEVFGTTVTDDPFEKRTTPLEAILGAHYHVTRSVRIGAGFGGGLTRGYGSPEIRGLLGVDWMPAVASDRDGDGILDDDDKCPDVKGPPASAKNENGCPARPDRDGDGVFDDEDACPDAPGPRTSNPSTNGCPADRDKDGILDVEDACPDIPGVKTQDKKTNGCPPDRDKDGVLDSEDACPDEPGPRSELAAMNGCPLRDRDKDGIVDFYDACPDEPGPQDQDPKRNGCPKAFVQDGQIKILDQVKFKTGKADIEPGKDSEEVLDAVLKVLNAHPEIKKVRVEGHTDSTGSAALNKTLSGNRAAAVVKWLTAHGIDKNRLTSQGFGPDRPLDSNATEEGRRVNRRVEFHIE